MSGTGTLPTAVEVIRAMHGGSRSLLVMDDDQDLWIVKSQDNPQHRRVLVNDYLGTRIASAIGLTVPRVSAIFVTGWLKNSVGVQSQDRIRGLRCGLHFGSKFMGSLMPGHVLDYLPGSPVPRLRNASEFAGIAALDLWLDNTDRRQAVFVRSSTERHYKAAFIDQGHCFGGFTWLPAGRNQQLSMREDQYRSLVKAHDCEPWLNRVEAFSESALCDLTKDMPAEWYSGEEDALERMLNAVLYRRSHVRGLFADAFGSTKERNGEP